MSWLAPVVFALGCASQSNNTDRQLRDHQAVITRLTATCDRLQERVIALEAAANGKASGSHSESPMNPPRPDLPTVKVTPERPDAEPIWNNADGVDATTDDSRRVEIVGEGSRVEARAAGDNNSTAAPRPSTKGNPRASKPNQGSLPKASTSGAPQ